MFELAPIGGVGWQSFCTWAKRTDDPTGADYDRHPLGHFDLWTMTQRVPITIGTRSVILICS